MKKTTRFVKILGLWGMVSCLLTFYEHFYIFMLIWCSSHHCSKFFSHLKEFIAIEHESSKFMLWSFSHALQILGLSLSLQKRHWNLVVNVHFLLSLVPGKVNYLCKFDVSFNVLEKQTLEQFCVITMDSWTFV